MRNKSIDVLRVLCAFLIVCIHIPFNIIGGGYYVALTRIGVPIFLMISGYYYKNDKAKRQIKKTAILFIEANLLYCAWRIFYGLISGSFPALNFESLIKFVLLNESPFSGHLWYLGAILYTLVVVYLFDKAGVKKLLYWMAPVLIIGDLVLGKYSLLVFGKEYSYLLVRNWLFTGIPFFSIGMLMREKKVRIGSWGIPVFIFATLLERFLLVNNNVNAVRDQYISTTFLAISVFSFALEYKGEVNDKLAKIGCDYSNWIYIIHPLFITLFSFIIKRIGMDKLWGYVGPMVVFFSSLLFVAIVSETRKKLIKTVS